MSRYLDPIKRWLKTVGQKTSGLKLRPMKNAFELLVTAILLVILISLFRLNHHIGELRKLYETGLAGPKPTISEKPPLKITQPQPGAMVLLNRIQIAGEAEDQQIVSLSVNNKIHGVTLAKNGQFNFDTVELSPGQNQILVRAIGPDGTISTLEEITIGYGTPMLKYLAMDIKRGKLTEKKIALTFDGGSEDNATTEILDYLSEKGIKTTIFLTGDFIRRYPKQVQRMIKDGHEIGNHTKSHPHLTSFAVNRKHDTLPYVTNEFLKQELLETERLFTQATGQQMSKLWRAPFGEHNLMIRQIAAALGYRQISWTYGPNHKSMDTMDWVADPHSDIYLTADEIREKILNFGAGDSNGANGAIILMHLGTQRATDQAHKMLPTLIDSLRSQGYELVKVSEIL